MPDLTNQHFEIQDGLKTFSALLFGAVADDYTGAADLAGMLCEQGVRTALLLGLPTDETLRSLDPSCRAAVVALKSRSIPAAEACDQSLRAAAALRRAGVRQLQFKYCSTFDSTADGNIGPVTEALMAALGTAFTVAVPALPVNGRTQYLGHLFVGDRLLSESPLRHHPVTPMTDPDLVRHLQAQAQGRVGLIPFPVVRAGAGAIREATARLAAGGCAIALVDALADEDLSAIAEAVVDLPLVTGGSGLGRALPEAWRRRGLLPPPAQRPLQADSPARGLLVLSGSCSAATLRQLDVLSAAGGEALRLDVRRLFDDEAGEVARLSGTLAARIGAQGWAAAASSAAPEARRAVLEEAARRGFSDDEVRLRVERATAALAHRAVADGVADTIVVAGGETTGAVTERLGLQALEIGDVLDPGVPVAWTPTGARRLALVFKSGNFGSPDFFVKALRYFGLSPSSP